ncbi:sensor histidine kinase [Nocardiopsis trehalosi]|uniref:sensor histidine kinase n=1 Tax=Nocardiopsis trehalosi TaxID=109329 RepID=UPI0009FBC490|nr:sensor histidine kinase [Nocardiopsis trehalosi]
MHEPVPPRPGVAWRRFAADTALAALLTCVTAYSIIETPVEPGYTGPLWLAWPVALATGLPLALRRRWPVPVLAAVLPAAAAATVLGGTAAPFAAAAVAVHTVASARHRWRSAALLAAALAAGALLVLPAAAVTTAPQADEARGALGVAWLLMGVAWALGLAGFERRSAADRAADHLVREAVAAERLRIAREMHDVVAHSMGLIAVKAGIANHVAAERPEEARDALRVIEATSRGALNEMRGLLGVLRSGADAPAVLAEQARGVDGLDAPAQRARQAGVRVDLDVRGPVDRVPSGVGLAVHRIVQESLTNVVKHAAPTACRVRVNADGREVRIDVADDGPGARPARGRPLRGGGHGVVGMRERAAAYGGRLTAGAVPGGGFRVSARIPYVPAAPPDGVGWGAAGGSAAEEDGDGDGDGVGRRGGA